MNVSVNALGLQHSPSVLLVETLSGDLLLVLTLACIGFVLAAFFMRRRLLFQVAVLTGAGWGLLSFIWLGIMIVRDRATESSTLLGAFGGHIQMNTGFDMFLGLLAALVCVGALVFLSVLQSQHDLGEKPSGMPYA